MKPRLLNILLNSLLFCILAPALSWAQVDEGLVAHWPFDETRGTIANDVSGNGLDGTVVGATWTQGRIGNALRFDGISDFVQVPGVGAPPPAQIGALGRGTIAFWLRFEDPDNLLNSIGFPMFYFGTQPGSSAPWDLEIYIGHAKRFVTDDRRIYYTFHRSTVTVDGGRQPLLCFNSTQWLPDLVFPATGSWTNWQTVTTTVDLDVGTHPVAFPVLRWSNKFKKTAARGPPRKK